MVTSNAETVFAREGLRGFVQGARRRGPFASRRRTSSGRHQPPGLADGCASESLTV
jgi:hypothetical protein